MNTLVRRERAAEYVLIVVVSFALSELMLRFFLDLRGYPQIAFSVFHISHVVWGGLFLFIAAMVMLIFSNIWVLRLGAVLSGMGFALFIDEIGKFITKDYNYFYGPALPLVYIFFLLVFLVYIYLHKQKRESPREMFYDVLDDCKEILDLDLTLTEKEEIEKKLGEINRSAEQPEIRGFAGSLLGYMKSINYQKELKRNWIGQRFFLLRERIKRYKRTHKLIFGVLLALVAIAAINSAFDFVTLGIGVLQSRENTVPALQEFFTQNFPDMIPGRSDFVLLFAQWLINLMVGMIVIVGLISVLMKRKIGLTLIKFALIFSLCSSDIIMLYYNQVSQFGPMLLKLAALGYLMFYERLYLKPPIDIPRNNPKDNPKSGEK